MTKTTANLNMRTGAGTDNSIILTIPNGSEVATGSVMVDRTEWFPVTYAGKQGWVSGYYLTPSETQTPYDDYVADAMALAQRMLGLYYRWAGNFTEPVFADKRGDCSGYVGFVADAMGYQPGAFKLYNYASNSMYHNFNNGTWACQRIEPGSEKAMDIVCYGTKQSDGEMKVTHIVYAVGDGRVIGSSGGYEATLTDADAKRVGAMVRYDKLNFHSKPIAGIFRPAYR